MRKILKTVREIAGQKTKTLYLPIALSCMDSMLHMGMFMLFITTIGLLDNAFSMAQLKLYSLMLLVLFVIRAVLYSVNYTRTQFRGADMAAELRLTLGDHIRSLNLGYFNKNSIGRLTSTLTTDIADFEQILTHLLTNILKVLFFSALALVFAFLMSWQYGVTVLILITAAYPLLSLSGKMAAKHGGRQRNSVSRVISQTVEYINGIKTFKLYNLTGTQFKRLDGSFRDLKRDSVRLELSIMPLAVLFFIITSLILPAALIVGTLLYWRGALDSQRFIALIMLAVSLSSMMTSLGSLYPEMVYLNKAVENIAGVRAEKPLPYQRDSDGFSEYSIAFESVGFSYEAGVEVLHDICFVAKPGTVTALVEPSGSGKTTVISLISRFWDVQKGRILVGGVDVKELLPDGLASRMAVVFQDVYLLHDTIANNIRVGKPDAAMDEVERAAKAAQCHDFIMALPNGYETVVGEGGSTLSGGEKQRVSIARALIKDTPIVLLDETTSNLDADNEREINRALDALMQGRTVVVIAHRLNTVMDADQIIVLDKGRIRERGTHQELLSQGGWYAQMIAEQERARKWTV